MCVGGGGGVGGGSRLLNKLSKQEHHRCTYMCVGVVRWVVTEHSRS